MKNYFREWFGVANYDLLINNDVNSTSSKNKAAKARNIPIVSELDFMKQYIEN